MNKIYTGIGSRSTPENVLEYMTSIAKRLSLFGYTLRSGGSEGADTAFEKGAVRSQIYLPWKGFNNSVSNLYNIPDKAFKIASHIHPAWHNCKDSVRKLHARDVLQVLGQDLNTPSKFVIYWCPYEGFNNPTGGTATAVRIARQHGIPNYNINFPYDKDNLKKLLNTLFVKYMQIESRNLYLFDNEVIPDKALDFIDPILSKGVSLLSKKDINYLQRFFKKYKHLKKENIPNIDNL